MRAINAESSASPAQYYVVHPLDAEPETKRSVSAVGLMPLTPVVTISLWVLRGYLVLMLLLVSYHVMTLLHPRLH